MICHRAWWESLTEMMALMRQQLILRIKSDYYIKYPFLVATSNSLQACHGTADGIWGKTLTSHLATVLYRYVGLNIMQRAHF